MVELDLFEQIQTDIVRIPIAVARQILDPVQSIGNLGWICFVRRTGEIGGDRERGKPGG